MTDTKLIAREPTPADKRDAERYRYLRDQAPSDVEIITTTGAERRWKVTFWLDPPEEFFDKNSDGDESLNDAIDAAMSAIAERRGT